MSVAASVFQLTPGDAVRYVYLRQRMLIDDWGYAIPAGAIDPYSPATAEELLEDGRSATFGIAKPGEYGQLVAVATVTRSAHGRYAHRARLLSVFADVRHRGQGLGEAVVVAALERARSWPGVEFVDLCVNGGAVSAQRLYARLGFAEWGRQPDAADYDGKRVDEIHMTLGV
jgi:RimJ/RimL family protein N-acetyltransferase